MSWAVTSQPTVFSVSHPAHWPQRWFFQQMSHSWSISVSLFCSWFCRYKAVPHLQMMQSWTASVCSFLCEWKRGLLIWIVGPIFPEGLAVTKTCLSFCELLLLPGSLGTLLTSQRGFVGNKKVQGFEECWAAMGFECDGNAYKQHKLFREKNQNKNLCAGRTCSKARNSGAFVVACVSSSLYLPWGLVGRRCEEKSSTFSPAWDSRFQLSEHGLGSSAYR